MLPLVKDVAVGTVCVHLSKGLKEWPFPADGA